MLDNKQDNEPYTLIDTLQQMLDVSLLNQKLLNNILKEIKERSDEGKRLIFRGDVSTTVFTILDTTLAPGYSVKGYSVENTGINPLFVAHNAAISSVGPDIIDINASPNIFELLQPGDITENSYNKNVVKNLYLLAMTATTSHKTKLFW